MSDKRRVFNDGLYAHFVTFSTYRRRRLLDDDHPKRIVLGVLNRVLRTHQARCIGFVIMPDHLHAIIWFPVVGQLPRVMHEWKRQSSLLIQDWFRGFAPRYLSDCGDNNRLWQPKYYSFEIYDAAKLEEKLRYMHLNPVRAKLVARVTDWKWSSARWYEERRSVGVPIEWID